MDRDDSKVRAEGLYYYRARYFDPSLGRFISADPLGLDAGPNLFAYVEGRPVSWTDPEGLQGKGGGPGPAGIQMGMGGKGGGPRDRGKTGKPDGTDNKWKKFRYDPKYPGKMVFWDKHPGRDVIKPLDPEFAKWWNDRHPDKPAKMEEGPDCPTFWFLGGAAVGALAIIIVAQPEIGLPLWYFGFAFGGA